ncbi:hypothetical protein BDZ89DRAFT_1061019 [Hymenopellis radicata]|nr:hypothetical protein BDZ89DRAFT_1061019 [Hymenopellis radicata]
MFNIKDMAVVALMINVARAASVVGTLDTFAECGDNVAAVCPTGTECTPGVPSFCMPPRVADNSTLTYTEVQGFGRPVAPVGYVSNDDPIPVWTGCTDANFGGSCLTYSLACDFCVPLDGIWVDSLSSIRIIEPTVGCNFWVSSNCVGDGINIDSGAIFDLSATNYNDRIVAFNCYLH